MAKKKGNSVSQFHSLMESAKEDLDKLDKVYSGSSADKYKVEKPSSEKGKGEENLLEEIPVLKEVEGGNPPLSEVDSGAVVEDVNPQKERGIKVDVEKSIKGRGGQDEKKVFSVSYKVTEKSDLAMLILSKSDQFPVRGKTEMLDYIIQKFCEKKAIQEVLNEGIKF